MASLAIPLGPLLRSMPPLQAYGWDIVGSMLGIAGFTILSAAGTPPIVWFTVASILVALLIVGSRIGWLAIPSVAALGAGPVHHGERRARPTRSGRRTTGSTRIAAGNGELYVNVNGIPHQALHPVDAPKEQFYDQLYKWFPGRTYHEVLIVGAGSGTDAAIALAKGAGHVDAVEIDRAIQKLGIDYHPDQPYEDPRVTRHENDGRAFLRGTDKQYDLVIFALPDSLTLVSTTANIRLESFLFTDQAFQSVQGPPGAERRVRALQLLPRAMADREAVAMLDETFESPADPPDVRRAQGDPRRRPARSTRSTARRRPATPSARCRASASRCRRRPPTTGRSCTCGRRSSRRTTSRGLAFVLRDRAARHLRGGARRAARPIRRFSPHFFVLGAAFLLLETRSLVSFSLLFGSTWLVNALAFFAILASVLLAILVNARCGSGGRGSCTARCSWRSPWRSRCRRSRC